MKTYKMLDLSNVAIIGSGPTAIFLLQNIWNNIDQLEKNIDKITIFEKEKNAGMGMPYNPHTTDIYNLANISSEEIPMLGQSFADWLRDQTKELLSSYNINTEVPIHEAQVYSRVALGHYFHEQFQNLLTSFISKGIEVQTNCDRKVVDIWKIEAEKIRIKDSKNNEDEFSLVIIANGHEWKEKDNAEAGYFASPWPIHKLLPGNQDFFNFTIGTLGASLSAFDVVSSLAHRHGDFYYEEGTLKFKLHKEASKFKLVLHSAEGWLPHLQYEQEEPLREIYRHFDRNQLLGLIDEKGFIHIEEYFNKLCRPTLIEAFTKDKLFDVAEQLKDESFSLKDLVMLMSDKHDYVNSFEGMKSELVTAKKSVYKNIPIHWMETLDDLMYSLNYHAELLPAEDHLFFHKEIMSFLMNVIAALPLQSATILLALYDAKCIELKAGFVEFKENSFENQETTITVKQEDGSTEELSYELFVNCGGQKKISLEEYPFQSLVKDGMVRSATAKFSNSQIESKVLKEIEADRIIVNEDNTLLKLPGIDVDSSYRTINTKGEANNSLIDINFTHTNGLRPYSYGLQACHATSLIVVKSWIAEIVKHKDVSDSIEDITKLYEDSEEI